MNTVTTAEAGLKKSDIYEIVFKAAMQPDSILEMSDIYNLVNAELGKHQNTLSDQGKASLRRLINSVAVAEGFIFPHDKSHPGWRITPEARNLIAVQGSQTELVFNLETEKEETFVPNTVRGALFEKYCLGMLQRIYPLYSWFHQGLQKNNERGLDLIAEKIGELGSEYRSIGVQVKNHNENATPTEKEWLKFMAGCFVRHIDKGIFITTGRLNSGQRREAGEAKVTVIEGVDEVNRIALEYKYQKFEELVY